MAHITVEELRDLIDDEDNWEASLRIEDSDLYYVEDIDCGSEWKTKEEHIADSDQWWSFPAIQTSCASIDGHKIWLTHNGYCEFISSLPEESAVFTDTETRDFGGRNVENYHLDWTIESDGIQLVDDDGNEVSFDDFLEEYAYLFPSFFKMSEDDDFAPLLPERVIEKSRLLRAASEARKASWEAWDKADEAEEKAEKTGTAQDKDEAESAREAALKAESAWAEARLAAGLDDELMMTSGSPRM